FVRLPGEPLTASVAPPVRVVELLSAPTVSATPPAGSLRRTPCVPSMLPKVAVPPLIVAPPVTRPLTVTLPPDRAVTNPTTLPPTVAVPPLCAVRLPVKFSVTVQCEPVPVTVPRPEGPPFTRRVVN